MWDEAWWGECDDPEDALHFLRGRLSPRQVRRFFVAIAHRIWDRLPADEYRSVIAIVADVADGHRDEKELWELWDRYARMRTERPYSDMTSSDFATRLVLGLTEDPRRTPYEHPLSAAQWLAAPGESEGAARKAEAHAQLGLLWDVFGDPFSPVQPNPEWFTPTTVALAKGVYEDRAFDRLPILADALQDAGCDDPRVLNHCRQPLEHDRGCWVVDMVLGHERPLSADDWDTTTDLRRMIRTAWPRATDRKIGLVACGCARQDGDWMRDDIGATYVRLAERHLDGQLPSDEEWPYAEGNDGGRTDEGNCLYALSYIRICHPTNALINAAAVLGEVSYAPDDLFRPAVARERAAAPSRLMRCVLGNPLRSPVEFPIEWKPAKVVKLAGEIYDNHAFDRMPELAMLLEDAGCTEARVLAHCCDKGPFPDGLPEGYPVPAPPVHCRGCWVIDRILGKG